MQAISDLNPRFRRIRVARYVVRKIVCRRIACAHPAGARYIQPSFAQRIYLLWIFRHFRVLPLQVLTPRQRRVIDALCVEPRFVPLTEKDGWEAPIIGTLERRPPIAPAPVARTPGSRTRCRRLPPISRTPSADSRCDSFGTNSCPPPLTVVNSLGSKTRTRKFKSADKSVRRHIQQASRFAPVSEMRYRS